MERQLSSAKRDQILIDEAREDNKTRKDLAESMLQSNQVFAQSMLAVSSSMMCIAQTMSRSFEMLSHALALPEQGMTQPSNTAVPFMSQPPRLHEGHMPGMIGQSSHHSQLRQEEGDNNLFTFKWFEKITSTDVLFALQVDFTLYELVITDSILVIIEMILFKPQTASCSLGYCHSL